MSGVNRYSPAAHDHRLLCEVFQLAHDLDQVDSSNLLCLELLTNLFPF